MFLNTVVEIIGPRYRSKVGIGIEFGWALGYIILPGFAYLLRDFRSIQLVTTLSELILLIWWLWIPESPRWQMSHNQFEKGKECIIKAARENKKHQNDINMCIQSLISKCQQVLIPCCFLKRKTTKRIAFKNARTEQVSEREAESDQECNGI